MKIRYYAKLMEKNEAEKLFSQGYNWLKLLSEPRYSENLTQVPVRIKDNESHSYTGLAEEYKDSQIQGKKHVTLCFFLENEPIEQLDNILKEKGFDLKKSSR